MERNVTITDMIGPLNREELTLHTGYGIFTGDVDGKFGSYLISEGERVIEACGKASSPCAQASTG